MERLQSPDARGIAPNPPVLAKGYTYDAITEKISDLSLNPKLTKGWLGGFSIAITLAGCMVVAIVHLLFTGVGIWGNNQPVGWAFDIINFVWWIGIGHAGTLISAILLLLKQNWRTSINRFAEAMTIFAVACAGLYPLLHTGRPWLDYWLFPFPNSMGVQQQFRSPLLWDVFAISTYASVSTLFWFVGLIPDLAVLRDRAVKPLARKIYAILALGWRGSAQHWRRYRIAYLVLAGLSTPLVLSVHTIVSFDFAESLIPGWHTTIFPPYFVAGAIYSGFAMVLSLCIPLRKAYGLEGFITARHLNNMAKVMLAMGLVVGYGYAMEAFMAWYSGSPHEMGMFINRTTGPMAWSYWALIACNIVIPQTLWLRRARRSTLWLFIISIVVNVGMWLERFVIIVTSLYRDFIPSSWHTYVPTIWDFAMFFGTIGFFLTLFFLFIRYVPVISIAEMRELSHEVEHGHH
ncbi:MAG TPA: NrfD/PsrC family molybdoenzyme membrane anchor subunit [Candidatus Kapabacteria bacterium]|nr:NrfD/PsrC family molybdoenzyme membrane anchor subunit [Candidatus Kapabacteria bacterium]